jgi:hypothetical protein
MLTTKKYSTKRQVRRALDQMLQAEMALEAIRTHYNLEWGEDAGCDLDRAVKSALSGLEDARKELDDLLRRSRGKSVPLNFPKRRNNV